MREGAQSWVNSEYEAMGALIRHEYNEAHLACSAVHCGVSSSHSEDERHAVPMRREGEQNPLPGVRGRVAS